MNALALLLSLAGAPAAPVAAPPAAEPAAQALIGFIAAGGYCMNVDAQSPRTAGFPACALQLDGGAFWAYVRYRAPMSGRVDPVELVLIRETPQGTMRIAADAAGRIREALVFLAGPCTLTAVLRCPRAVLVEDLRARKELEDAAMAARPGP